MDFFTVPTLTFGVLYCFLVIAHDRCKILRFNVTRNPNAVWIVQQIREAWPYARASIDSWCSIATQSLAVMWFRPCVTWEAHQSEPTFGVRGRTELRSVGWEVADESYWTT